MFWIFGARLCCHNSTGDPNSPALLSPLPVPLVFPFGEFFDLTVQLLHPSAFRLSPCYSSSYWR